MANDVFSRYFDLSGRRAIVTGAGRGIGRAIAEGLAAAGAEVLVHYHSSADAAAEVVNTITDAGGAAFAAQADLRDPDQARSLFEQVRDRWEALDILVNNTGDLVRRCEVGDLSDDLIDDVLRLNVASTVYVTREAAPMLRKGEQPSILNIGSVGAHTGGIAGASLYVSAKGAIHTFTRAMAKELAPTIRVNALAPGIVDTDFHKRHTSAEQMTKFSSAIPLGRFGTPDDHAAAAIFLAGAGASYITGECMEINGGLYFV